ncbi:unnamed protein product, partial [Phaeothamnion confervicola]
FNGLEDAPSPEAMSPGADASAAATSATAAAVAAAAATARASASGWLPHNSRQLEKMARQSLLLELTQKQQRTYEAVVDWFLSQMPATYFRQTTEEARLEHLQAITAMIEPRVFEATAAAAAAGRFEATAAGGRTALPPTRDLVLHFEHVTEGRRDVTFIQPGTRRRKDGLLALMGSLPPADGTLRQVKVFNSKDGTLAINVFGYTDHPAAVGAAAAGVP